MRSDLKALIHVVIFNLIGCSGDLLPGEVVVPGELAAEVTSPEGLLSFGADVAVSGDGERIVATAPDIGWAGWPGEDEIQIPSATSINVWFDSERAIAGVGGFGIIDINSGELLREINEARSIRGFDGGWLAAHTDKVIHSDGREWIIPDPRTVAVSSSKSAVISCDEGECHAFELISDGEVSFLGEAGDGGDIWIDEEVIWWGAPDLSVEGGSGSAHSSDGQTIYGVVGGHLGRSIGGGYVAGGVNWDEAPRRVQVVPLGGGTVISLDGLAGPGTVSIDSSQDLMVLGLSGWVKDGATGAVITVEKEFIQ